MNTPQTLSQLKEHIGSYTVCKKTLIDLFNRVLTQEVFNNIHNTRIDHLDDEIQVKYIVPLQSLLNGYLDAVARFSDFRPHPQLEQLRVYYQNFAGTRVYFNKALSHFVDIHKGHYEIVIHFPNQK